MMQEVIQKLIDKGHAYLGDHGDVYFDTESFPGYGKLSKRPKQENGEPGRTRHGPIQEEEFQGFCVMESAGIRERRRVGIPVGIRSSGMAY